MSSPRASSGDPITLVSSKIQKPWRQELRMCPRSSEKFYVKKPFHHEFTRIYSSPEFLLGILKKLVLISEIRGKYLTKIGSRTDS